ncbi:hypothetical protein RSAG8_09633, partial [Rhizoctonia solani AG-8 WAC10335]
MSNDLSPNVIYLGYLSYYKAAQSPPTPFYVVMPNGVGFKHRCFVLGSFGTDAAGVTNRPVTSLEPTMAMTSETSFDLRATGKTNEYYWFQGTVKDDGEKLSMAMLNPDNDLVTTVELTKQNKSLTQKPGSA